MKQFEEMTITELELELREAQEMVAYDRDLGPRAKLFLQRDISALKTLLRLKKQTGEKNEDL